MDADQLIDRRRLRRKLSFWRAATIVIVLGIIGLAIYAATPAQRGGDHIARIDITGVITDDTRLIGVIEDAAEDDAVKAIVVSVSTPGGTTYGGEQLSKVLIEARKQKPVVADVRTLAASAGYMIAASTDHIVAGETSIVGSIGVIFQYPQVGELMDKIGVSMNEIKSSPLKAEPSPFHPASPEAEAMIRSMVLDSYDWFVDLVAEERDMDRQRALSLSDGSIFTGRQGLENGLVDALGGETEIRAYLKERGVDETLDMLEWKPRREQSGGLLPSLVGRAVEQVTGGPVSLSEEIRRLGGGKLFLDGLLSLWQAGENSPMTVEGGYQ
jgi:protease IV